MALQYVSLPLFPDPFYEYSISLQGVSLIFRFTYSDRSEAYFIDLLDQDNNPIVMGERLVPGYPLFKDYALFPLTGWIWMEEIAEIISEPYKVYPDKIDEYYLMWYVYDDGE